MKAFDRLYFLSKLLAAIHCDAHYHRQRSFFEDEVYTKNHTFIKGLYYNLKTFCTPVIKNHTTIMVYVPEINPYYTFLNDRFLCSFQQINQNHQNEHQAWLRAQLTPTFPCNNDSTDCLIGSRLTQTRETCGRYECLCIIEFIEQVEQVCEALSSILSLYRYTVNKFN